MSLDGTEVRVAGAGHVYAAPAGTALPTDLDTLDAAYVDLGYVTTDGVGFTFGREVENIDAWQGTMIRILTTAAPVSVTFALMQSNRDVLPIAFGGGEFTTDGDVHTFTPGADEENTERVLVIEFTDGDFTYRYCLARVQLQGEITFTLFRTGPVTYPLTFGVLDNGEAAKWLLLSNDPAFAEGS